MPTPVPIHPRCLHCDYILHGLPSNICPECGTAFDPARPLTVNRGRLPPPALSRFVLNPHGASTAPAAVLAVLSVYLLSIGLWCIVPHLWFVYFAFYLLRELAQIVLLLVYRQPLTRRGKWPLISVPTRLFAVVLLLLITDLPLRLRVFLGSPWLNAYVRNEYYLAPARSNPPAPGWLGTYYVHAVESSPSGITLYVDGSPVPFRYVPDGTSGGMRLVPLTFWSRSFP